MSKKMKIVTSDNKEFEKEYSLLEPCLVFKNKVNEPSVHIELNGAIFEKVLAFLQIYSIAGKLVIPEPLPDGKNSLMEILNNKEYFDFIEKQDFENTFELINAGAMLEFTFLHDLACAKIAFFMKGKTPEQVNAQFTIECQLTTEEAKELGLDVENEN